MKQTRLRIRQKAHSVGVKIVTKPAGIRQRIGQEVSVGFQLPEGGDVRGRIIVG